MIPFLCEEGLNRHRGYVEEMRGRLAFLYRSCEELRGLDTRALLRVRGSKRGLACEVLALRAEILLHEIYFSSFSERAYPACEAAKKSFGSALGLLNELKRAAIPKDIGFVGVCRKDKGLRIFAIRSAEDIFSLGEPLLAIDMAEHAYFMEFGFNREEYLARALAYLNLPQLDENK